MKILVTGGIGFIGSHLVDALVSEGHQVRVLDSLEEQVHQGKKPEYLNKEAEYIIANIAEWDKLKKAISGIDIIFHEAAAVGVGQSMYQVSKYIHDNTFGTANLLDILVNEKHKVRKLIVASSMSIYGEGSYRCAKCGKIEIGARPENQMKKKKKWEIICPKCESECRPVPTDEEKKLFPTSIYAMSKMHQEEMCLLIGKTYNIPTVALRYFNVYGPRQSLSNPYTGVCAIFAARIKSGQPPIVYEDGLQSRDFVSVKDIVRANIFVMKEKKCDYQYFNVGTGKPKTILDIAALLIRLFNKDFSPQITNTFRKGDIRHCFSESAKLRRLGFKLSVDFEEGIRELIRWQRKSQARDKVGLAQEELRKKGLIVS